MLTSSLPGRPSGAGSGARDGRGGGADRLLPRHLSARGGGSRCCCCAPSARRSGRRRPCAAWWTSTTTPRDQPGRACTRPTSSRRSGGSPRNGGLSAEEVGARCGASANVVRQRLRLAAVNPALMDLTASPGPRREAPGSADSRGSCPASQARTESASEHPFDPPEVGDPRMHVLQVRRGIHPIKT